METNRDPRPVGGGKLRSEFAGDPEMIDLVRMFVDEMPQRVDAMLESWRRGAAGDLRRHAHQLKGACGGYGFPVVGAAAGLLEASIASLGQSAGTDELSGLREQIDDLVGLCLQVVADPADEN